MNHTAHWANGMADRLERYHERYDNYLYNAEKREKDIYLKSYAFFLPVEDLGSTNEINHKEWL